MANKTQGAKTTQMKSLPKSAKTLTTADKKKVQMQDFHFTRKRGQKA